LRRNRITTSPVQGERKRQGLNSVEHIPNGLRNTLNCFLTEKGSIKKGKQDFELEVFSVQ